MWNNGFRVCLKNSNEKANKVDGRAQGLGQVQGPYLKVRVSVQRFEVTRLSCFWASKNTEIIKLEALVQH